MRYLVDEGTVVYAAKDGNDRKVFEAEEWLAAMCSHVPNRREQMVRYYGWYSKVLRGKVRDGSSSISTDKHRSSMNGRAAYS
jgi:hypothetical protein